MRRWWATFVAILVMLPSPVRADDAKPSPRENFFFGSAIALLMNRTSLGFERLPAPHHSIGLSGYCMAIGITHGGPNVAKGTVFGAGVELGYRYYALENGPDGPFVGVAAIWGYYNSRKDLYELKDDTATWYHHYGAAIDMGWAFHFDRITVLAFAIGAQRTWTDERGNLSPIAQLLVGDGVRPRVQFQVGRVF
jgi:hypothetical protein